MGSVWFQQPVMDPIAPAFGLINYNFNPTISGASTALTSQRIDAVALYIPLGKTVTNINLIVEVAGTSTAPTGFFVGLATPTAALGGTGKMVAQSNNLSASGSLTATGLNAFALNATYTANASDSSNGFYYVVILQNGAFGGTNVTFERGNGTNNGFGTATTNGFFGNIGTGQTALAANGNAVTFTAGAGIGWWVGVS